MAAENTNSEIPNASHGDVCKSEEEIRRWGSGEVIKGGRHLWFFGEMRLNGHFQDLVTRVKQLSVHNNELKNALAKKHQGTDAVSAEKKKKGKEFDFSKCHQSKILDNNQEIV